MTKKYHILTDKNVYRIATESRFGWDFVSGFNKEMLEFTDLGNAEKCLDALIKAEEFSRAALDNHWKVVEPSESQKDPQVQLKVSFLLDVPSSFWLILLREAANGVPGIKLESPDEIAYGLHTSRTGTVRNMGVEHTLKSYFNLSSKLGKITVENQSLKTPEGEA